MVTRRGSRTNGGGARPPPKALRARITSKGQITLPRELRDDLGLEIGGDVEFVKEDGVFRVRRNFDRAKFEAALKKWRGYLKLGKTTDELIEEMRGPVDID
jgi:AbrB family looped-hinge helix DNA binding protein